MRVSNWPAKLQTLVENRRRAPFQWGVNDCLLWPADVAYALTGEDPALEFRGTYDSALSAMRIVKGAGGIGKLISQQLRRIPTSVRLAQRGDVLLYNQDGRLCGGVCLGDTGAFLSKSGLTFIPMKHVEPICWRVG